MKGETDTKPITEPPCLHGVALLHPLRFHVYGDPTEGTETLHICQRLTTRLLCAEVYVASGSNRRADARDAACLYGTFCALQTLGR